MESLRSFFFDPFPVDLSFLCSGDCIGSDDVSESPESLDEADEASVLEPSESGLVNCWSVLLSTGVGEDMLG